MGGCTKIEVKDEVIQKICIELGYFPPDQQTIRFMKSAYMQGYIDAMNHVSDQMDTMIRRYKHD